jgi:hypothetical protein
MKNEIRSLPAGDFQFVKPFVKVNKRDFVAHDFATSVIPPIKSKPPIMRPTVNGCGCILNQPKWSISSEVISAEVTVNPTNGPAPLY